MAEGHTSPGGRLPLNTNGGGLSYTLTGMYGMFAIQESIRQMRGDAPAQVAGVEIAVTHGVGVWFSSAATLVWGTTPDWPLDPEWPGEPKVPAENTAEPCAVSSSRAMWWRRWIRATA